MKKSLLILSILMIFFVVYRESKDIHKTEFVPVYEEEVVVEGVWRNPIYGLVLAIARPSENINILTACISVRHWFLDYANDELTVNDIAIHKPGIGKENKNN